MIRFACPNCKQVLEASDGSGGQVFTCSGCRQQMRAPVPPRPPRQEEPVEEVLEVVVPDSGRTGRTDRSVDRDTANPFGKLDDDEYLDDGRARPRKGRRDGGRRDVREALPPEAEKLGPMRSVHEGPSVMPILGMILCGLCGVMGLSCLPFAFTARHAALAVPAIFFVPVGTLGFLLCWWSMGHKVITFEKGFVQIKRGKFLIVPWDDIECVWQSIVDRYVNGIHQGTFYTYTIELHDGGRVRLTNNLGSIKRLGQIVMHESSQVVYPRVMKAYNRGKIVDFGALGVSQDGLHYGSSLLVWDDIDAVEIKGGYISVSKRGKWFNWCNIAASSIPNLYVFMSLVNQVVGIGRR
jgi:hypothetical protein